MSSPQTESSQRRRERARLEGLCIVCVKRKARPGKSTCKPCNEAAKERVARSRQE